MGGINIVDTAAMLMLTLGGGVRHAVEVYRQLQWLQLELQPGGSLYLNGVYVVGKGTNSVVFKCRPAVGSVQLACKIRRADASRTSLAREGQFLYLANSVGVGPKLYTYSKDVVVYRYVEGVFLEEWWRGAVVEAKRSVVEQLLTEAFSLDKAGVSHGELARLEKNVIVEKDRAVIIDFESATLRGGNNVTQLANGLMRLGLKLPLDELRRYKKCLCREEFVKILRFFLNQL